MEPVISDIIIKSNNQVKRVSAISIELIDQKFKMIDSSEYMFDLSLRESCWVSCDKYFPEVVGVKIGYYGPNSFMRTLLIRATDIETAKDIYNQILNSLSNENLNHAIVIDIRCYTTVYLVIYEKDYRYGTDICGPIASSDFREFFNDQYEAHKDEIIKKKEELEKKNSNTEKTTEDEKSNTGDAIAVGMALFLFIVVLVVAIIFYCASH